MKNSPEKKSWILVTGAAGFVAYHFIKRALEDGYSVIGVDNLDPFYGIEQKKQNIRDLTAAAVTSQSKFEFVQKDIGILSPSDLYAKNITTIFHFAAKAGVRPSVIDPFAYELVNVQGTLRLLNLAKDLNIKDFVFTSSSSVYGTGSSLPFVETASADSPLSPYAASKRSAEIFCKTYANLYEMRIAILRLFTVYGPRQRPDLAIHLFLNKMKHSEVITLFDADNSCRDYTYATDIVEGIFQAYQWLKNDPKPKSEYFNLGSGRSITPKQVIRALELASNLKAITEKRKSPLGEMNETLADLSKSRSILGYSPQMPFEEGIRNFFEWYCGKAPLSKRKAA